MQRYETAVRDGVLYLEAPGGADGEPADDPEGWLEIGSMDAIVELVGGETYELQYDERQRQAGWLDTDEDGRITFDVRETIRTTTFDDEFVQNVAGVPDDETTNGDGDSATANGETTNRDGESATTDETDEDEAATADDHSRRAAVFADLLTTIWDSKGNLEA